MTFDAGSFHIRTFRPANRVCVDFRALGSLPGLWRRRLQLRRDLKRLLRVGPHAVADIGLTAGAVQRELEKPFWHP